MMIMLITAEMRDHQKPCCKIDIYFDGDIKAWRRLRLSGVLKMIDAADALLKEWYSRDAHLTTPR